MKETIAEYARLIIVILSFGLIVGFIFSGTWLHRIGQASGAIENRVVQTRQDEVFDELTSRTPPQINVFGFTANVGETIKLVSYSVIPETYHGGYPVQDADGNNLIAFIKIECDSPDFNPETKELIPSKPGIYTVTYTVEDKYGLSSSRTISINII